VTGSLDADDIPSAHQAIAAGIGIGSIALFTNRTMKGLVRVLPRFVYADFADQPGLAEQKTGARARRPVP
jgi:hypothetical protein